MKEDQRVALCRLFEVLQVADGLPRRAHGASKWRVRQGRSSFGVEGEGLKAFWDAVGSLTRPALGGNGLSEDEAKRIVDDACAAFVDEGTERALAQVDAALSSTPQRWVVMKAWSGLEAKVGGELRVGACAIRQGPPGELQESAVAEEWAKGPTIAVEVEARDMATAEVVGIQRIEEAIAVLHCADATALLAYGADTVLATDDAVHGRYAEGGGFGLITGVFDEAGRLSLAPFGALSLAAATPFAERTEWQRRVVTAARWYSRALDSRWPTDSLVAAVVAIEALVGEHDLRGKGERLGQKAAHLFGGEVREQRRLRNWFSRLYTQARNPAVHAGLEHNNEIEVGELVDVCGSLVERSAFHLDPSHRRAGPCQTLNEVLGCASTLTSERRRRGSPGNPEDLGRPRQQEGGGTRRATRGG